MASDIKLVVYSSTITMMHGPINIRLSSVLELLGTEQKRLSRFTIQALHTPTESRDPLNWTLGGI